MLIILMVLMLSISLVGCNNSSTPDKSNKTSESKEAKYPTKAINLMVPFAAGGSSDMMARLTAEKLGEVLGQPVVVVNTTGGSGAVGIMQMLGAKHDGYYLLHGSNSPLTVAPLTSELPYSLDDFTPIAQTCYMPMSFSVNANSEFQTFEEVVQYLKENPGKIDVGTPGAGSIHHLTLERLGALAGVQFTHMPFEGANPAVAALLGEHVASVATGTPEVISHHKNGTLRILATYTEERLPELPDVPTFKELGYDVQQTSWYGYLAPKAVPQEIIDTLEAALEEVVADEGIQTKMRELNLVPQYLNSEELTKTLYDEIANNKVVLEQVGLIE